MAGFDGMDSGFVAMLQAMFNDAPGYVGITGMGGYRSSAEQKILYDKYLRGEGPLAAKPGQSNHNHGLAADLSYGSNEVKQWVLANAHRYGMAMPLLAQGEDWHIEPGGVRDGSYVGNSSFGGPTQGAADYQITYEDSLGEGTELATLSDALQEQKATGTMGEIHHAMLTESQPRAELKEADVSSMDEIVKVAADQPDRLEPTTLGVPQIVGGVEGGGAAPGPQGAQVAVTGTGIEGVAQAAYNAGFRGDDLITMVAIAGAEGGYDDPGIRNLNYDSGDDSWGHWQINVLAGANPQYRGDPRLTTTEGNAQLARTLWDSSGFQPWSAWKNGLHTKFMGAARTAVNGLNLR
jgi:hypothetical protein